MSSANFLSSTWGSRVVFLSLLLFFFTLPHTLEDFALGAPQEAGIAAPVLALVISILYALQALGLFFLGQKKRLGLFLHMGIGVFWPVASGFAQLPVILTESPYRAGAISVLYVFGMIAVGVLIFIFSLLALRAKA